MRRRERAAVGQAGRERAQREAGVLRAQEQLESTLAERTRELHAANQAVQEELEKHRQAEQDLTRNEERLNLALKSAAVGTWYWDIDRDSITCDPSIHSLFGLQPGEFPGRFEDFIRLVHAEDRDRVAVEVVRSVQHATDFETDFRVVWPDGSLRVLTAKGQVYRDAAGRSAEMTGVCWDSTELRQAYDALKNSNERFELIARATNDAVWDWDIATDRIWWNDGVCSLFGYSREDVQSDAAWWFERVHPEDQERAISGIRGVVRSGRQGWSEPYRFRRADGAYADVLDRGFVLRDASGKALRMIGAMADISAVKRVSEALRESENRYRLLFERNPQPQWIYDPETLRFLAVNEAAIGHYGYSREEFLGMTLRGIRPPEEAAALMQDILSSGTFRHRKKDGTLIDVEIASCEIQWEGLLSRLVLVNDVTGRKRLEEQLAQSQKMEAVGRLAGGIAHDFNNLLTVIGGHAELLLEELPEGDPRRERA
ncbi:MAG: PAS domain-containing protein, partial [Candidatus Solibacter usitatus]|nr:PAS domain-containing protein [Candidatus Solibacter usitatus]